MFGEQQHREVPIKVNVWVDEGIAELVIALNKIPGIVTVDSCEGTPDKSAYVYFIYHESPNTKEADFFFGFAHDLAVACEQLAIQALTLPTSASHPVLARHLDYQLQLEWSQSNRKPMAMLTVRSRVDIVALAVRQIADSRLPATPAQIRIHRAAMYFEKRYFRPRHPGVRT